MLLREESLPGSVTVNTEAATGLDDLLSVASEDAVYVGRGVLPVAYAGFKVGFRVRHRVTWLAIRLRWPVSPGGDGRAMAAEELQQLQAMKSRARAAKERGVAR